MPVDEKARRALDIKTLPPGLAVTALEAEEYTDSSGEPSLRVWVILDETVDVENVTGEMVGRLKSAIRENLRQNGVTVFPYIFLAKPSERTDTAEE
jgi:hypothetical protein